MGDGEVLERIGHRFRRPELLQEALTHRSFGTPHNERLEFLGDGALNMVIALRLFERFPTLAEGELSRIRAGLVNRNTLYELACALGLPGMVRLGEGELRSGGSGRPSILADALEALFGAVFLDGGFAAVERAVDAVYGPLLDRIDPDRLGKDPKTRLQEYLQGRRIALPRYVVVRTHGRAHEQHFEVECVIEELSVRALGRGSSRRSAEQEAAENAYAMVAP